MRGVAFASVVLFVLAAGPAARAQDLVTPVRVGRADAPLTLNVWAQQDYSHLAARPAIAGAFTSSSTTGRARIPACSCACR